MSRSASCSDRGRGARVSRPRPFAAIVGVAAAIALAATAADARVFLSRERAVELAFGAGVETHTETVWLTDAQSERVRSLAGRGVELRRSRVTRLVVSREGANVGTAYLDTHRVRTLQETLFVAIDRDGKLARVEVLAFGEPPDYLPRDAWLRQFDGRVLDADLSVGRAIHGITGATLSAEAASSATRRVLAIHAVLEGEPSGPSGAAPSASGSAAR